MKNWTDAVVLPLLALVVAAFPAVGTAQEPATGEARDGVYQITLKTEKSTRIILDELVRDRDLDPKAIYRPSTGGYLAFGEREWVEKIEFKVFDIPVSMMPDYGKYSKVLVDINKSLWSIRQVLSSYDDLSFRLMDICGKSKFLSLRAVDRNIVQQLSVYKRLILLKSLVTNALARFVRDRTCVDRFDKYESELDLYTKRLTELCRDYDRLRRRALEAAQQSVKSNPAGSQSSKTESSRAVSK